MADLPDDLPLPLASGEPWWYWLGGRPSVDFVNTLRERWWRRVETLVTPEDLVLWLQRAELLEPLASEPPAHALGTADALPAPRAGASAELLAAARELRESIDAALTAVVAREPVPPGALATIDAWLGEAVAPERLSPGAGGMPVLAPSPPADPVRHALGVLALDAARMLGTDERARLRICASDTCSARFYDRSPTGARVWCSMRGCGNVAKARRHRERARGARA